MDAQIIEKGFERVWKLFEEADRRFQENERKSEREFQELRLAMRETDQAMKETDRRLQALSETVNTTHLEVSRLSQEVNRTSQEVSRTSQEVSRTSQEIRRVSEELGRLGNHLGKFVEYLIKPAVVKLFQERGIEVCKVSHGVEANNRKLGLAMEIDLLVINHNVCILIEVKSQLEVEDINEHIERLEKFKLLFPEHKDSQVMGAVAGMILPDAVARYGYKKGFFVIGQKGETAAILNDENFKPRVW